MSDHPAKLERGEDEEYGDYICRQADAWRDDPPPAPEGFELVPCDHEPQHMPVYVISDSDFYPAYCTEHLIPTLYRRIDELQHQQHRLRGRCWQKVASWLYVLGVISGSGSQWNAYCNGCVSLRWRGKRPYILGLSRQQWACLSRGHRFRPLIDCGLCAICLPCPDCGSTEADHWYGICLEAES